MKYCTLLQKSLVLVVVGYGPGMHLIGRECMDWDLHWVCRGDCVLRPMLSVQGCAGVRVCWNLNCVCRGEHRLRHTVSMQGWVCVETFVECAGMSMDWDLSWVYTGTVWTEALNLDWVCRGPCGLRPLLNVQVTADKCLYWVCSREHGLRPLFNVQMGIWQLSWVK